MNNMKCISIYNIEIEELRKAAKRRQSNSDFMK